ncbi:hypothetical protein [Ectobacillus ponti]|uniref:Uncharacterized protein n=1 Tax=Ectobacillus ponti TaxID=2961894 RepID=A0AA42BPM1_9BACI|nr:hypothetical protein [Ectobacillus ponti]MCP8968892.1 hypothetical protein [Ectobacillus ponti]
MLQVFISPISIRMLLRLLLFMSACVSGGWLLVYASSRHTQEGKQTRLSAFLVRAGFVSWFAAACGMLLFLLDVIWHALELFWRQ